MFPICPASRWAFFGVLKIVKVWVLKQSRDSSDCYFVNEKPAFTNSVKRARWFQTEGEANDALTFNMKHDGFVATKIDTNHASSAAPKANA